MSHHSSNQPDPRQPQSLEAQRPERHGEQHEERREAQRGLGSRGAGAESIRTYCLIRSEVRASDLQRVYRLSFSESCRALEELEALRALGSMSTAGARCWSVRYPVEEDRVRLLRKAFGWGAGSGKVSNVNLQPD